MKVRWSQEAGNNLIEIEAFIARDSAERAAQFIDALVDHAEALLPDNPRSGRAVPEIGNPEFRELIFRGYRIVYRLNGEHINILTVFEGHRQLRMNETGE